MLNRAWMEVDLGALVRNARALRDRAGVGIIPMIKADAYGLGAVEVAHALEALSPVAYGVATVDEGRELRVAGISRQIIVFTPLLEADFPAAHAASLTPTLGSADSIAAWSKLGGDYDLSIDTGMARAGLPWRDVPGILEVLREHPPSGAFTHFHSPNLPGPSMDEQERRFRDAIAMLPSRPRVLHTDSSAAIVRHGESQWDAVRPGIFMYGVGSGEGAALQPEHVVSVRAPIVEIRDVDAGDTVSYEATWTAPAPRRIATLSIGYADGYPRNAGGEGVAIVRGRVVPIVGRVTMDMIMIDITDNDAGIGDAATLIGGGPLDAPIDVQSVASIARMSPYELLTGLRGRMRRIYKG
ncbi:MAG TPA: alanine racemase [Gemmatimonadaceae bacterium]|nr:alanine racemase [Gemmatimonadaceae bacterium]